MYKAQKGKEKIIFWFGKSRYNLAECSQKQLKYLYDNGIDHVKFVEPKKESKETEDKKSVDGKEG
tara:strand:+ start:658 stop:852 length:195 start_codon:yes stop_codon:yes gene_type:complete